MISTAKEKLFFLKKSIRNIKQFGAILPSSKRVTNSVAKRIVDKESYVVELGAGTGNSTASIIESGVDPSKIIVVELDKDCCEMLRKRFSEITVLNVDAGDFPRHLPANVLADVGTIVSSIPLFNLAKNIRESIFRTCFNVLGNYGKMIVFSYSPIAPIKTSNMGIESNLFGFVLMNIPPVYIWEYKKSSNS